MKNTLSSINSFVLIVSSFGMMVGFPSTNNHISAATKSLANQSSNQVTIVGFGDSNTEGFGVNSGEDFLSVLESKLESRSDIIGDIATINAGQGGETTTTYEFDQNLRGDIGIIMIGSNDFYWQNDRENWPGTQQELGQLRYFSENFANYYNQASQLVDELFVIYTPPQKFPYNCGSQICRSRAVNSNISVLNNGTLYLRDYGNAIDNFFSTRDANHLFNPGLNKNHLLNDGIHLNRSGHERIAATLSPTNSDNAFIDVIEQRFSDQQEQDITRGNYQLIETETFEDSNIRTGDSYYKIDKWKGFKPYATSQTISSNWGSNVLSTDAPHSTNEYTFWDYKLKSTIAQVHNSNDVNHIFLRAKSGSDYLAEIRLREAANVENRVVAEFVKRDPVDGTGNVARLYPGTLDSLEDVDLMIIREGSAYSAYINWDHKWEFIGSHNIEYEGSYFSEIGYMDASQNLSSGGAVSFESYSFEKLDLKNDFSESFNYPNGDSSSFQWDKLMGQRSNIYTMNSRLQMNTTNMTGWSEYSLGGNSGYSGDIKASVRLHRFFVASNQGDTRYSNSAYLGLKTVSDNYPENYYVNLRIMKNHQGGLSFYMYAYDSDGNRIYKQIADEQGVTPETIRDTELMLRRVGTKIYGYYMLPGEQYTKIGEVSDITPEDVYVTVGNKSALDRFDKVKNNISIIDDIFVSN